MTAAAIRTNQRVPPRRLWKLRLCQVAPASLYPKDHLASCDSRAHPNSNLTDTGTATDFLAPQDVTRSDAHNA